MVYKKYINRGGKKFGPYYYESYRDTDGKVKTRYIENYKPKKKSSKKLFIAVAITCLLLIFLIFIAQHSNQSGASSRVSGVGNSILNVMAFTYSSLIDSIKVIVGLVVSEDSTEQIQEEISEDATETPEDTQEEIEEEEVETEVNETEQTEEYQNETQQTNVTEQITETNETITNTNITANETIINQTANQTILDETITNETTANQTTTNETILSGVVNETSITTKKSRIIINRPVKWVKTAKLTSADTSIKLPKKAQNITIKTGGEIQQAIEELNEYEELIENADREKILKQTITGLVSLDVKNSQGIFTRIWNWLKSFTITGNVIEEQEIKNKITETEDNRIVNFNEILESEKEIAIEYYTEAPTSEEQETENGKKVTITGPDEIEYEEVLAYSELDNTISVEQPEKIMLLRYNQDGEKEKVDFDAYDLDSDGKIDYIEWVVPHLSEQIYEIIYITKAVHLDENSIFINDIYQEVKTKDNIWSETINPNEYVRVTFEIPLDNTRDITIYARSNQSAEIEVYAENSTEVVAKFENILEENWYKVYLTNLPEGETYETFDLKILNSSVEFDYIVDPFADNGTAIQTLYDCGTLNTTNTVYTLNQSITTTGTCFNVTANNITIDFAGYNITGSGSGISGIYVDGYNDTTIKNGEIRDFGDLMGGAGIYLLNNQNNNITNMTLTLGILGVYTYLSSNNTITNSNASSNLDGIGFYIYGGSNNTLSNNIANSNNNGFSIDSPDNILTNNIANSNEIFGIDIYASNNIIQNCTTNSNNQTGIYLWSSSNSIIQNCTTNSNLYHGIVLSSNSNNNVLTNNIVTSNPNSANIYISRSSNNNITDSNFSDSSTYDISLTSTSINNIFSNCSYDISKESVAVGSNLTRKWHIDVQVNDSSTKAGLANINVTAGTEFSVLTGATGSTRQSLTEYTNEGGTRTYNNPDENSIHTITAYNSTYVGKSNSTGNIASLHNTAMQFNLDKHDNVTSCGNLYGENIEYNLTTDISTTTTCFNVYANNITIDFNGNNITSTGSGTGVSVTYYNGTTIRNGKIHYFSSGIQLIRNQNNNITNMTITNSSSQGIYFYLTSNSVINKNTITNSSDYGIWVQSGSNNTITNNIANSNAMYGISLVSNSNNNNLTNNTANSNLQIGFRLQRSSNNTFVDNTANSNSQFGIWLDTNSDSNTFIRNTANSNAYRGFSLVSSSNNNITDSNFSLNTLNDVVSTGSNNIFLNCSYSLSKESVGGELIRKWYYQAYVNDTEGNPVSGADVKVYAVSRLNILVENLTTNASGWTNVGKLIDYVNTAGTRTYYSNYSIVAFNTSSTDVNSHNVTQETNIMSDIFTIVVDTTAPVITSHSSSASYNSVTISWIVDEPGNASINYGGTSLLGSNGGSLLHASEPSITISNLASNTTYYYNITSCDVISNCVTGGPYSFTTTLPPAESTSSGGGSATVHNIGTTELKQGVSRFLQQGNTVNLYFPNIGHHTLKVNSVTETSATITISSNPITVTLSVGETKTFDLDDDETDDLSVTLESISNGVAKFKIKGLNLPDEETGGDDEGKEIFNKTQEQVEKAQSSGCAANIACKEWSECKVSYTFEDLLKGVEKIKGKQLRLCEDKNDCINSYYENQECSIIIDIYAKEETWCSEDYIFVYDKLTDELLARINNKKTSQTPFVDIAFLDNNLGYCEYCFNSVLDEDEQGVDCGGSCKECLFEEYSLSLFDRIMRGLGF